MTRYCEGCGIGLDKDRNVCTICGRKVTSSTKENKGLKTSTTFTEVTSAKKDSEFDYDADVSKIVRAGKSMQFLGWLVFIFVPVALASEGSFTLGGLLVTLLVVFPVVFSLIYFGKRVVNLSKNTARYLNIGIVLNVLFIWGLIPILVLCNISWARGAIKRIESIGLKLKEVPKFNRNQRLHLVVAVALFLLLTISGVISVAQARNTGSIKNGLVYTSPGEFRVEFPGEPEVSSNIQSIDGYDVVGRDYLYDGGDWAYMVQAFDYPEAFDLSDTQARLESGVQGMVETDKGGSIVSKSTSTFAGERSIDATIKSNYEGQPVEINTRVFLVGQRFYIILSISKDGSVNSVMKHLEFADSFQLL